MEDKSLKEENEEIVGKDSQVIANAPANASPRLKLAVKLSEMNNASNQHLVGVLCTLVEATSTNQGQNDALKSLIRRELYNSARDRVKLIHSIVGRAEVKSFREHPTLEEQLEQPGPDSTVFDNE